MYPSSKCFDLHHLYLIQIKEMMVHYLVVKYSKISYKFFLQCFFYMTSEFLSHVYKTSIPCPHWHLHSKYLSECVSYPQSIRFLCCIHNYLCFVSYPQLKYIGFVSYLQLFRLCIVSTNYIGFVSCLQLFRFCIVSTTTRFCVISTAKLTKLEVQFT